MVKRIQRAEPSTEPVTLAEARAHLRLDTFGSPPAHPEDDLISLYISAARQFCEDYLGHSIAYRILNSSVFVRNLIDTGKAVICVKISKVEG